MAKNTTLAFGPRTANQNKNIRIVLIISQSLPGST